MSRGFIPSEYKKGDYVLGGAYQLKGQVLVSDGNWTPYLPEPYLQSKEGFEPYDCVTCAITAAIETLIKQEYSEIDRYSRRWLAWASGTQFRQGNDPTTVARVMGGAKIFGPKGHVQMADWPDDFKDFYKDPPKNINDSALAFLAEFEYDNQWIPATPEAMLEALQRSPLTVGGYAWTQNSDGLYYWPDGAEADHYFLVYGAVPNHKWLVLDTYENVHKELVWDYPFIQVKEHTLHRQVIKPSFFEQFLHLFRQILGLDTPALGAARSPQWAQVEKTWVKDHPRCEFGGHKPTLLNPLNVHHIVPFHNDPTKELDPSNLISVCRFHHLYHAHFGNWKDSNPNVREDARAFTEELKAHA